VATNRSPRRKRGPQKDRWRAGRRAFERATGKGRYLEGQLLLPFDVSPDMPPVVGVPSAAVDLTPSNKEPSDG
jgi:hypothetical protein